MLSGFRADQVAVTDQVATPLLLVKVAVILGSKTSFLHRLAVCYLRSRVRISVTRRESKNLKNREEPAEVVQASALDAVRRPPWGDVPGTSLWVETLGKTLNMQ